MCLTAVNGFNWLLLFVRRFVLLFGRCSFDLALVVKWHECDRQPLKSGRAFFRNMNLISGDKLQLPKPIKKMHLQNNTNTRCSNNALCYEKHSFDVNIPIMCACHRHGSMKPATKYVGSPRKQLFVASRRRHSNSWSWKITVLHKPTRTIQKDAGQLPKLQLVLAEHVKCQWTNRNNSAAHLLMNVYSDLRSRILKFELPPMMRIPL